MGLNCESNGASSAGPTLQRCSARANSSKTLEAGRCQPRNATSGSASSAGSTGACWGKSAQTGPQKPAATSTSVASSRSRIGVPARRLRVSKTRPKHCRKGASRTDRTVNASAHDAQKAAARHFAGQGRHDARLVVQHGRQQVGARKAPPYKAMRLRCRAQPHHANWARGAAAYNSNSQATCASPMRGNMCKSSLCRALKDWR